MARRAGWVLVAVMVGCQGSVGPGGDPPDGAVVRDGAAVQKDKWGAKPKLDQGKPKPKLDKGKPPDKKALPDPCKPLPKGCLCAQACVKGACDNTRCPCKAIPGASYGATLSPSNPSKTDPKKHVDVNLLVRKRKAVGFTKGLVTKNTITLKYTTEDDVVKGYTVHISGICVEPKLQKLYDQCHKGGRKKLPALKSTQPLGRAIFGEIQVAIRDTGAWMDPRSRKDWWQGK